MSHYKPYPRYKDSGVEWLGRVPEHWEIIKLKRIALLKAGESISSDRINETDEFPVYDGNGLRGYTSAYTHDGYFVLIGRQGALCGNINYANGKFWASEHAIVVSSTIDLESNWLGELLLAMNLNQYSISAAQPGLSVESISNLFIPYPSLSEQQSIATFLNSETALIDALIEKKQRLVELLKEKRQVVITQAVTKGLDPNVPMKDSGVEWLGEVPENWEAVRAKVLFRECDERSVNGEEELLTVSHITGVTPRSQKDVNMFEAETLEGYKTCRCGDVIVNTMWAWMGALGTTAMDGLVSPSYNVYRVQVFEFEPAYYDFLFRTPLFIAEINRYSKGIWSSRLRLYPEQFLNLRLPVPPPAEQRSITSYLYGMLSEMDDLAAKATKTINLLKERRSALITAAVTGQIDVRDAA
jgi:type I restriction enzyme S subunit